jgi:hypothetical protein
LFIQSLDDVSNVRASVSSIQFIIFVFPIDKIDQCDLGRWRVWLEQNAGRDLSRALECMAVAASPMDRANARLDPGRGAVLRDLRSVAFSTKAGKFPL